MCWWPLRHCRRVCRSVSRNSARFQRLHTPLAASQVRPAGQWLGSRRQSGTQTPAHGSGAEQHTQSVAHDPQSPPGGGDPGGGGGGAPGGGAPPAHGGRDPGGVDPGSFAPFAFPLLPLAPTPPLLPGVSSLPVEPSVLVLVLALVPVPVSLGCSIRPHATTLPIASVATATPTTHRSAPALMPSPASRATSPPRAHRPRRTEASATSPAHRRAVASRTGRPAS